METVHTAVLLWVPAQLVVVPVLLYPQVGRHHLLPQVLEQQVLSVSQQSIITISHHINQLGELQLELDGDGVRDVDDGPHQLVVAGEQVVKQPLGVWITLSQH